MKLFLIQNHYNIFLKKFLTTKNFGNQNLLNIFFNRRKSCDNVSIIDEISFFEG